MSAMVFASKWLGILHKKSVFCLFPCLSVSESRTLLVTLQEMHKVPFIMMSYFVATPSRRVSQNIVSHSKTHEVTTESLTSASRNQVTL